MSQELFERFTKCAVVVLSVDASKVTPEKYLGENTAGENDTELPHLGADSLDLVEFVMALEEEFGIEVPESDLEGIETVAQAFALVTSKVK
jgi:acyl carrier protein